MVISIITVLLKCARDHFTKFYIKINILKKKNNNITNDGRILNDN